MIVGEGGRIMLPWPLGDQICDLMMIRPMAIRLNHTGALASKILKTFTSIESGFGLLNGKEFWCAYTFE